MPLQFDNEEHKRRVLQLKGFDPDRFDVDVNSGNVVPRQQIVAPAPQLAPKPVTADIEQPKVSIGKSAAIGAATGVLPAAGGLAAMGALQGPILGASAATGPAAPLTYAGLNIAAAIGGGSLVNWAQNKLMPESAAQAVAEAQQVNPTAFALGNIAGQLPVMAANPRGVVEAVKTGGKVVNNLIRPSIQPLPISLAEKANLANVGVGAALPAGISGVNAVLGNEEINPKTLALEIAGGALLNKPTQLGSKLLRTPHGSGDIKPNISPEQQQVLESSTTPEKTDLKTYGKALESAENKRLVSEGKIPEGFKVEIQIKPPEVNPKKAIEDNILSPELRKVDPKGRPKMALPESGVLKQLKIKQDVVYPFKSAEESAAEMFNRENQAVRARDRLEYGGENPQGENYNKTGPESLGLPANKTPEQIASERESNYTLYRDLIKQGKLDDAMSFSKKLGEGYYFGRRYTAEKASGKPEALEPVQPGKLTAAENQLLAARRKNFQGLSDSETQLSAEKRLRAETEKAGNIQKLNATKKYWDEFRSIFEPLRGIKAELDSKLKNPATGKAVRGQIDAIRQELKDYSVKINPNLATPDTLGHEFLHGFITDLKTSGDKNQRAAVDNLLDVVSKSPEFKADNETRVKAGKKPLDAEEFLTETSGYELFNKLVNLDNQRGTYKESWRNFVGQVKAKLGKSSIEDIQRYVANRFIDDPSRAETTGQVVTQQTDEKHTKGQDAETSENAGEPQESGSRRTEGIEANKPEEVKSKNPDTVESDFDQYQKVQTKLRELFNKEGGMDSPEFKELWQQSEVIKNRNGGHVPKKNQEADEIPSRIEGANTLRAMDIFGAGMYDKKSAETIAKESIQNATDAFESNQKTKEIITGKDSDSNFFIADSGKGMSPMEVLTKFLPAFESGKQGGESRGSFGLAKIALLGSPENWNLETAKRVGDKVIKTNISGSPENWKTFVKNGLNLNFNPNEPGVYDIHGMKLEVLHESPDYPTGTVYKSKTDDIWSMLETSKKMLADISHQYDVGNMFMNSMPASLDSIFKNKNNYSYETRKDFLSRYTIAGDLQEFGKAKIAGASIKILADSNAPAERVWSIPIFNRGLRQFELPFYQDVMLPRGISFEVSPTVGVESPDYPYTTNRDNLKGAAKIYVEDELKKFGDLVKNEQIKKFKNVEQNARTVQGTQTKYLDLSGSVPADILDDITTAPILINLGKVLKSMSKAMADYAKVRVGGHLFDVNFKGFASGGGFYGVRFGSTEFASKGEIYIDPFLLHKKVSDSIAEGNYSHTEYPTAYAEATTGVFVHEMAHQINHSEGEAHARAMTDLAGILEGVGFPYQQKIKKAFEGDLESHITKLDVLTAQLEKYEDKNIANTMVGIGRGEKLSASEQADNSKLSTESKTSASSRGLEGTGNESKGKVKFQSGDEVQATTPEAIRANINSTIEAPEFKKSGLIRQNLGELKTRLPIFGSDLDKLSSRQGESGNYIAPAIKEALAKTDEYEGRWFNPSLENIKSLKYADQQLLVDTLRAEHRQGKSLRDTLPTEELKKSYDIQRELLKDKQQNQIEANQPVKEYVRGKNGGFSVVPRLPKINQFYFPDIAGGKQLDIILNYEGSDAFNKLKADFINHIKNQYKFDDKVANEFFEDYRASFSRNAEATSRFGAVRKAEGVGLPDSWLEADPAVTLRRYWRRVARDRAWFDAVEKDPNNLYILNQNKDAWDRDVVPTKEGLGKIRSSQLLSDILENVHGMATKTSPKLDALVRIANNLILGPLTGVNDLLSVLPLASKFAPSITDLPRVYTEAVSTMRQGIKNAKAQGRIKEKISDVEDIWMPSTDNVERLRQVGDGIAKISGREKLEEWSRGLAQSAGESLIRIHRNSTNPKSIEFLKGLANKEDYTKMSDAQLASRIVDITQGTYDVRGLPSWAINSQVAPFFRMMKWNIEQLNNLHKHVIVPASNGNLTPLILSLTAGAVGGYVAKETREMLSGKNLHYPSLSEIANADGDKLKPVTYAAAAAISYSGVLGLLGEVFKSVGDISYKNKPNAPSFPAMEVATDIADNIFDAIQAIGQEGEDPLVVLPKLTQNLFTNNIQVGRMLLNRFGDIDDQQQRRDLRVFKQLTGRDYSPQSVPDNNNQFVGLKNKEVKKAENATELFRATKNRVNEIVAENKNDPRSLSTELKKLKTGGVTTMPSLQNSPEDFSAYYKYLVKQHGKAEADRRVAKYSKQLSLNKTRRALVPSLN